MKNDNLKDRNPKTRKSQSHSKEPIRKTKKNYNNTFIWAALAVVFIITFFIYFKTSGFGFVWDDNYYITYNNDLNALTWENIKLFFAKFYIGNYQPITILTYAIEQKISKGSFMLFHVFNIFVHLINTYLVFLLIKKISPKSAVVALITAAFFAVHPMHVESVAWVSGTKDLLYTCFLLLGLIFYTNYLKSNNIKYLIYTGVFFILSCLSKSAAVILPLVMLIFDFYYNRRYSYKMFLEKIPFFAISIIFGIVAVFSQRAVIMDKAPVVSFIGRISTVSFSLISYLYKTVIPIGQSALYPFPNEIEGTLPLIYYFCILLVSLLVFFVWFSRRWGKNVISGFLFFIVTIILVLQFVPVGSASMADRYTYVPYIGLFFIVGKIFEYYYVEKKKFKNILVFILISGFLIFSIISNERIKIWENDDTLFTDVISKYPDCSLAYYNRGAYYLNVNAQKIYAKNSVKREMYINYSIKDFDKAIENNPDYTDAYINRSSARNFNKDFSGAIKDLDKAIALDKNNPKAEVYVNRGIAKNELKEYSSAIKDFDNAIGIDTTYADAYTNRGCARFYLKDYEGALLDYNKVIVLNPHDANAYKNRDVVSSILGNSKK